jgi:hypothetical protein
LIADADGGERAGIDAGLAHRDAHACPDAVEDLVGIVLDPTGPWRDLSMLELVACYDPPVVIEQQASTACRPLVDGGYQGPRCVCHETGISPRFQVVPGIATIRTQVAANRHSRVVQLDMSTFGGTSVSSSPSIE